MPIIPIRRAQYFYAFGIVPETNKKAVAGPFKNEMDAREGAADMGEVKIYKFNTRDPDRAKSMIRSKLARTDGIKNALGRMGGRKTPPKELPDAGGDLFDESEDL